MLTKHNVTTFTSSELARLESIAVKRLTGLVYPEVVRRMLADVDHTRATRRRLGAAGLEEYRRRMLAKARTDEGPWLDTIDRDGGGVSLVLSDVTSGHFWMSVDPLTDDVLLDETPA